jgi:ribonuclease P protein component
MLPHSYRLRKSKDFESTYRKGRLFDGRLILARINQNSLGHARVGIIVSKKVSKKAVQRNKIRRQIRDIIRSNILSCVDGYDLAIIAKPISAKASYSEIEDDWQKIWLKINQ